MNIKTHKQTRQRELVLSILKDAFSHLTADQIYELARKILPQISKGTVYRNLRILTESEEITRLSLKGTIARYEAKQPFHYHFRCDCCGRITDVNIPAAKELDRDASQATGFKVSSHQLEFRGWCQNCQPTSAKS